MKASSRSQTAALDERFDNTPWDRGLLVGTPEDLYAACDTAGMSSAPGTLERHRAAVRARLLSAGAVRSDASTVTWKLNREVIVIAGWGRAILLQLAHPLIAAGVADHSSFRGSLITSFKRLSSTVGAMLSLTFGTDEEAIAAAAGINGIHDRVSGTAWRACGWARRR